MVLPSRPYILTPLLAYMFAVLTGFEAGAYGARGIAVPGISRVFTYVGFLTVMTYWVRKDSKRSESWHAMDLGLYMFLLWPVMVPYYLLKTRGAKGLVPILTFLGSYVVAFIVGFILIRK